MQLCPRHFSQAICSQTPHQITHSITPPFPKIHLLCQKCFLMAVSLLFSDRLTYGRVTTFIFSLGFLPNPSGHHITALTTILPLPPYDIKKTRKIPTNQANTRPTPAHKLPNLSPTKNSFNSQFQIFSWS